MRSKSYKTPLLTSKVEEYASTSNPNTLSGRHLSRLQPRSSSTVSSDGSYLTVDYLTSQVSLPPKVPKDWDLHITLGHCTAPGFPLVGWVVPLTQILLPSRRSVFWTVFESLDVGSLSVLLTDSVPTVLPTTRDSSLTNCFIP